MRDEPLRLGQQAALADGARADAALDALDQHGVLAADLVVEREQLGDPALVRVGGEEVVEEALGALGAGGQDRPDRDVRAGRGAR